MNPEPLTCPYCNARVPWPAAGQAPGRVTCPRCGEVFPYHPPDTAELAPGPLPTTNGPPTEARLLRAAPTHFAVQLGIVSGLVVLASLILRVAFPESPTTRTAFPFMFLLGGGGAVVSAWLWYFRRPRTNAGTAAFLLGNMVLVALIVLPYALLTTEFRRSHDPPRKTDLGPSVPGERGKTGDPRGPAALAALGYLPADSNLIVGVDVARMLVKPAGKAFLDKPSWGPLETALGQVEKWTGLKKEAIDHIALGTRTHTFPWLRLTVVVQTTVPYDPALFRFVLDKEKSMEHHERQLYPIQLPGGGQGALWCVGERTLLLRLWWDPAEFREMKASLPLKPRPGIEELAPALRDGLEKRLPRDALVWIVGESVPVPVLAGVLPLGRGPKGGDPRLNALLKEVRVFDSALRFPVGAEEVVLIGDLECPSVTSAERLQGLLERRKLPGLGSPRVVGPARGTRRQALLVLTVVALGRSPGGSALAAGVLIVSAAGPAAQPEAQRWVRFQLRATPELLREALRGGRLLPGMGQP
jgi:hypothetical protein